MGREGQPAYNSMCAPRGGVDAACVAHPKKVDASCKWALVLICGAAAPKSLLNTRPPDLFTM